MVIYLVLLNTVLLVIVISLLVYKQANRVTSQDKEMYSENHTENEEKILLQRLHLPALKINLDGLIEEYNHRAKELFPSIEVGKSSEIDLVVSEYEPQVPFKEAFVKKEIITKRLEIGQKVYELKVIPIYTHGNITSFYEIISDTSELEELRKTKSQRSKLETIGHLSMGMAHDFNNILQVIIGNAELCLDEIDDQELQKDNLETIIKAGEKASSLTKQLLIFTRKQEVEKARLDVNDSLSYMRKMLTRLIGENITIELKLSAKPITVLADEIQFEQIILNLCLNSRDAMDKGGIIQISTELVDVKEGDFSDNIERQPGSYLKLSVADTGSGILPENISKIFDPFFTTKSLEKGTGLGLSNVQSIVKQYGGFIDIESNLGFGTVFKIYLPTINIHELKGKEAVKNLEINTYGKKEKILLIEDDELIRNVVIKILKKKNFEVIATCDIQSANKIIKEEHDSLDLIVSDLVLPDGDGYTLYNSLREKKMNIPFIITSGYTREREEIKQLISVGINFIRKPFSSEELISTVNKTLIKTKI